MSDLTITALSGSHLTAADRRNIKAILELHRTGSFKVNNRKTYTVTPLDTDGEFAIAISENSRDDFGRRVTTTYRSTIATRKAAA